MAGASQLWAMKWGGPALTLALGLLGSEVLPPQGPAQGCIWAEPSSVYRRRLMAADGLEAWWLAQLNSGLWSSVLKACFVSAVMALKLLPWECAQSVPEAAIWSPAMLTPDTSKPSVAITPL